MQTWEGKHDNDIFFSNLDTGLLGWCLACMVAVLKKEFSNITGGQIVARNQMIKDCSSENWGSG